MLHIGFFHRACKIPIFTIIPGQLTKGWSAYSGLGPPSQSYILKNALIEFSTAHLVEEILSVNDF